MAFSEDYSNNINKNKNRKKRILFLSIIIPCKNEEKYIGKCLGAIFKYIGKDSRFEILVIDNGSTDNTINILKKYKKDIQIYHFKEGNISDLRNLGASKAKGEWFAFIDADVEVDSKWYDNLCEFIESLSISSTNEKKIITGSTYGLPQNPSWIEKTWYSYLIKKEQKRYAKYINGGNLITEVSLKLCRIESRNHA